jgi:hypothetical protein
MATENKKYLDLVGLQHLIDKLNDEKRLTAHPKATATSAAAVKVGQDADGHVVLGGALSYNDLQDKPVIGNGTLTIKANGASKGTFTANQEGNSEINITASDLGLGNAMHFKGSTATELTDGATTNPIQVIKANNQTESYTALAGDVVLYSNKEFVWNGTAWEELGDESSHALKTITITAGEGLTGGGTLESNRTISHATSTAVTAAAVKVGRDGLGHVVIGGALGTAKAGKHTHDVSATISKDSFLKSASGTKTKLSLNKSTDTVLKSYSGAVNKLATTQITGVSGKVSASKASAGADVDVAKAGTAVVYGKANVGSTQTVATKASTATTVGNANVGSKISITGVAGTVTASKATAGAAVNVATTDTPVTVATRSASKTTVGNANVGTKITITGVNGKVTASKATAGDAVSVAKVGSAVTYGTADCGTAVTGVAKVGSQITYGNANCGTAVNVTAYDSKTPAYSAAYDDTNECLNLTAIGFTSITPAAQSSSKAYVCADGTGVSITPAAKSTKTLTPAADNGQITPYTFADIDVPVAASSATEFFPATSSSTEIYTVGGTTSITPAKANGSITPYTFANVDVPVAAETATEFYSATSSSATIFGVGGTVDVTSAVAAPAAQTIVPAVANGKITPYTFADVDVPVAASSATTVATGSLNPDETVGATVLVGLGTATTATALLSGTTITSNANTGDVTVVTEVNTGKHAADITISGTAAEAGEHNHTVQ